MSRTLCTLIYLRKISVLFMIFFFFGFSFASTCMCSARYLNFQLRVRSYQKTKELFKVNYFEILRFITYFASAADIYID